ncbi:(1-_4)-alpha-D-glucan synthase (UDP-glucose) [Frankineae bacterium MT45]|nr:(1->4)-alpha-D-glucan synthase (UDP-glucose) [Frankineae bacterium MT45]
MLSWEYPPLIVGGLGRHVDALARTLVAQGHEVRVVTRGEPDLTDGVRDGVGVSRSRQDPLDIGFTTETLLAWSQANEHSLTRAALAVVADWKPDVVHAHDWLVAQTAVTISEITGARVVATIHATETGRNMGWLASPLNRGIHSVERWLTHRAARVIVCSTFMRDEVSHIFEISPGAVEVIGNGIDLGAWRRSAKASALAREQYAGDGPLLVFAGRLMHAKGVQTAIGALPRLRRRYPGLRLVVAGTGPFEPDLRDQARRLGRAVQWAGFVEDSELAGLLAAADVAVVPSLYEPFGLVALEAAAIGTPLAVSDTGGLRDLVEPGRTGARFTPDSPAALATAVESLLDDPQRALAMTRRARRLIAQHYTWEAVASQTAEVYAQAAEPA